METRVHVRPIRIKYKCPKCISGHLVYKRDLLDIDFSNTCDNKECNYSEILNKKYPYIEYEEYKNLPPGTKGYICSGNDKERVLLHGWPVDPDEPKGEWECWNVFPVVQEHQDKIKFQEIYLMEEVEIREVEGKKIAFIKNI